MSEELDTLVENIRQPSAWLRVVFMLGFAVALYFVLIPVIIVIVIVQALFAVLTGESNENLRYFAAALGVYVSQIIRFLTYNSETKPFPFSDFPQAEETEAAKSAASKKQASGGKSAAKKSASKKGGAKKTAAKKKSASRPRSKKAESDTDKDEPTEAS